MGWVMKMLATNLRTARNNKGYTQDDVAEHLGVKRQTYSAYERSKSIPDALTLNKLAKFFDVNVDDILGNENLSDTQKKATMNQSPDSLINQEEDIQLLPLIKILRNLKPDAIEQITPLVEVLHELPKYRKDSSIDNEMAGHIKKVASNARIILKDAGATTIAGDRIIKKSKHKNLGKMINELESLALELVSKIANLEQEENSNLE